MEGEGKDGRVWVGEHLKDRGKGGELEGEGKDGRVWVGEHLKDRGKGGELEGEGKDGRVWVGEHLKDRGKGGELEGGGKVYRQTLGDTRPGLEAFGGHRELISLAGNEWHQRRRMVWSLQVVTGFLIAFPARSNTKGYNTDSLHKPCLPSLNSALCTLTFPTHSPNTFSIAGKNNNTIHDNISQFTSNLEC